LIPVVGINLGWGPIGTSFEASAAACDEVPAVLGRLIVI
jgi:hypothetical protein